MITKKQLPTQFSIKGLPKEAVNEFKTKLKKENTTVVDFFKDAMYEYIGFFHNVYIEDIKAILQSDWGKGNYITVGVYKTIQINKDEIYFPSKKTYLFMFEDKVYSLYMTLSIQEKMAELDEKNKQYYESTYISDEAWTEWFTNLIASNKAEDIKETVDMVRKHLINWTDNYQNQEVYYNTKIYGDLSSFCVSEMAKMKV
jgi:hypothetical protein